MIRICIKCISGLLVPWKICLFFLYGFQNILTFVWQYYLILSGHFAVMDFSGNFVDSVDCVLFFKHRDQYWNFQCYSKNTVYESFEPSQTSLQREHKLSRKSHLKVRPFSDCPDCVLSFELMINILLHDRQSPVLSCYVCIISYWWGKFEIQWKSLGHASYVNHFSVQERLTRESVYLYDGSMRCFLVRATWTHINNI